MKQKPQTPDSKEGLHTPGEWAIRPRGDKSFYDNGAFVSIYSKELGLEGGNICSIYSPSDKTNSHKPTDEQKANAELIVKAVNNYERLKDVLDTVLCRLGTFTESNAWENEDQDAYDLGSNLLNELK